MTDTAVRRLAAAMEIEGLRELAEGPVADFGLPIETTAARILAADPALAEALELGLAWAACEAACRERFGPELVHHNDPTKGERGDYAARSTSLKAPYYVSAHGPTPALALLALATKLGEANR